MEFNSSVLISFFSLLCFGDVSLHTPIAVLVLIPMLYSCSENRDIEVKQLL